MIFYLKPPSREIPLADFKASVFNRLEYFLRVENGESYDIPAEKIIPGTVLDAVGHFILRCLAVHNPDTASFIRKHERQLFVHRLKTMTAKQIRDSARSVLSDIPSFKEYKRINPISDVEEKPYHFRFFLIALRSICKVLYDIKYCKHLVEDCKEGCSTWTWTVPHQYCTTLVRTRSVTIEKGIANIPCSLWKTCLDELYNRHWEIGVSMIHDVLEALRADDRWRETFNELSDTYDQHKKTKPKLKLSLSFRHVDAEEKYFPLCMSHLLSVLRDTHRLSYHWRYKFSLFLKDMGLDVNESIDFWKNEYSKSCTKEAVCTHSWHGNERKYVYSIRHIYGLEGSKIQQKSKSCSHIQNVVLGMREEGGCPFVHFDDKNLKKLFPAEIAEDEDIMSQIMKLRKETPGSACSLYVSSLLKKRQRKEMVIEYESPIEYYFTLKDKVSLMMDW